jgi:hypothetical protein
MGRGLDRFLDRPEHVRCAHDQAGRRLKNVCASAVQPKVVVSNRTQVVPEQPVCTLQCQAACVHDFQKCFEGGMFADAWQVREQISYHSFTALMRAELALIQRPAVAMQFTNMNQGIENLTTGDRPVQHQAFSSKSLAHTRARSRKDTIALQFAVILAAVGCGS